MQNTGTSDVYYITALPFINMHPQSLVPGTLHYAIQEHRVTRLARRHASSHLIRSLSKHLVPEPSTMRSIPELFSVVACLVGFLPLISSIYVMRYAMFGLSRAQQVRLCHEFGGPDDVRPCIQTYTVGLFPNTAGLSMNPLVTKLHHTALLDLWGWPTWWMMHDRCCTGPRSGYLGSTTNAKTCLVILLPWIWKPTFGNSFSILFPTSSTFHPVRMHRRLVPTSAGDHITRKKHHWFHASGHIRCAKLVHLYHLKMCTQQDGHGQGWIPFLHTRRLFYPPMQRQVLGWCLVWHDYRTGIDTHKNGFWWAHMRVQTYTEHSGCVCASLLTTMYPNWGDLWSPGWVFWAVWWGMSPQRLETSPTGRFGAVHVEHRSSSTAS